MSFGSFPDPFRVELGGSLGGLFATRRKVGMGRPYRPEAPPPEEEEAPCEDCIRYICAEDLQDIQKSWRS